MEQDGRIVWDGYGLDKLNAHTKSVMKWIIGLMRNAWKTRRDSYTMARLIEIYDATHDAQVSPTVMCFATYALFELHLIDSTGEYDAKGEAYWKWDEEE